MLLLLLMLLLLFLKLKCECKESAEQAVSPGGQPPAAAPGPSPPAKKTGSVEVSLLDGKGELIQGVVKVSFHPVEKVEETAGGGEKNPTSVDLPPGKYHVLAEAGGFAAWKPGVAVEEGIKKKTSIVLAAGTICVRGTLDGSKALPGDLYMDVRVYDWLDAKGAKELQNARVRGDQAPKFSLKAGAYRVRIDFLSPGGDIRRHVEEIPVNGGEETPCVADLHAGILWAKATMDGSAGLPAEWWMDVSVFGSEDMKRERRIATLRAHADRNALLFVPAGTYDVLYEYMTPFRSVFAEKKGVEVKAGGEGRSEASLDVGRLVISAVLKTGGVPESKLVDAGVFAAGDPDLKKALLWSWAYGGKKQVLYLKAAIYHVLARLRENEQVRGIAKDVAVKAGSQTAVELAME